MEITLTITAEDITKEDLSNLIRVIQEWGKASRVLLDTFPPLSKEETHHLEHLGQLEMGLSTDDLFLGSRMVVVSGKIIGTCEDMILAIGEANEQAIEDLKNAQKIELIRKGSG